MRYSVGLDVGTTGLKGLLVNERGAVEATAFAGYEVDRPHPGWSQQNPEDWWQAARLVVRELAAKGLPIGSIGLSGQMHGSVFLDENGTCLSPAILWNDQRTYAECDEIVKLTGGRIIEWTMNEPRTAFTASKILWARKHLPEVWAKTRTVLLPKDHVRFRLTGERLTDVCDASGTNLLDVRRRQWSQPTLAALDIPESVLPGLRESPRSPAGSPPRRRPTSTSRPARRWLPAAPTRRRRRSATASRRPARCRSPSARRAWSMRSSTRSSWTRAAHSTPSATACRAPGSSWRAFFPPAARSAGSATAWPISEAALAAERGVDAYDVIFEGIEQVPAGADGLVFLPYLTGERSPHNDPHARGATSASPPATTGATSPAPPSKASASRSPTWSTCWSASASRSARSGSPAAAPAAARGSASLPRSSAARSSPPRPRMLPATAPRCSP